MHNKAGNKHNNVHRPRTPLDAAGILDDPVDAPGRRPMQPTTITLTRELVALRKGRGTNAGRLGDRVGPALRRVCRVHDGDSPAELRRKVVGTLRQFAERLPADLRDAVTAALGLHPDAHHVFYQERIRWLADRIERDDRTARRRVDDGIGRLAELAAERLAEGPPDGEVAGPGARDLGMELQRPGQGWYIESFRAALVLDLPALEAYEQRVVVAEQDGLAELDLSMTVPPHPAAPGGSERLGIDVLYGGTLAGRVTESAVRVGFRLLLPTPLRRGEKHQYALRMSLPADQPMRQHYVAVPKRRCDEFTLRVRFDGKQLPSGVWRVEDAFHRDLDDESPTPYEVPVDAAGEIHLGFRDLAPAHGYGARWTFD